MEVSEREIRTSPKLLNDSTQDKSFCIGGANENHAVDLYHLNDARVLITIYYTGN